jgi:cytochrome c
MSTLNPARGALAVTSLWLCACLNVVAAEAEGPGLGEPLSPAELEDLDVSVLPDGTGLPPGRGSVAEGRELYGQHCLACHGENGVGGINDRLAGGQGTLATATPVRTVGSYWPYATTLFDYLRKAMPYTAPGSLSASESYALTAYLLNLNGIVEADAVLDGKRLPAVEMPNRGGFTSALD